MFTRDQTPIVQLKRALLIWLALFSHACGVSWRGAFVGPPTPNTRRVEKCDLILLRTHASIKSNRIKSRAFVCTHSGIFLTQVNSPHSTRERALAGHVAGHQHRDGNEPNER